MQFFALDFHTQYLHWQSQSSKQVHLPQVIAFRCSVNHGEALQERHEVSTLSQSFQHLFLSHSIGNNSIHTLTMFHPLMAKRHPV